MSPDQESEYLTLAQASEQLGISARTLERWAETGRIPHSMTPEGDRIFPLRDLLKRVVQNDSAGQEGRQQPD